MTVFPTKCIHEFYDERFSPANNAITTTDSRLSLDNGSLDKGCGNCWYCNKELDQKEELMFSKPALMMALTEAFTQKKCTYGELLTKLKQNADTTWPRHRNGKKATANDMERLLIQLFASRIVDSKCDFIKDTKMKEDKKEERDKQRIIIELLWSKGKDGNLVCFDELAWNKFNKIIA